jgi:hypothetical protein
MQGQTTAFNYQGRLTDGGSPANGSFQMRFRLFDALAAGNQIGSTINDVPVTVTQGVFSVKLDFGANALNGANRWIEIAVRQNSGEGYTTLSPREQVASAPYAVRTLSAATADTATNAITAATATNALNLGGVPAVSYLQTDGNGSGLTNLNANNVSAGTLPIARGGTNAATASDARTNLGLGTLATMSPTGTATATTFLRGDNTWGASETEIVASVDTQFSQDDRANWTHIENLNNPVTGSDDYCHLNIPLGFTFTGWGQSITSISVSSNGVLFFGQNCATNFSNTILPSAMSTNAFLAFFWDDLQDFSAGEYMEYATFGTTGGRTFNLFFRNRLFSGACGTDAQNLMITIHEGSNLVRVTYSAFSGCANMRGSSATFGMQGPGGATAKSFVVAIDSPILDDNAPRQSLSFLPPKF